ncbi:MAG: diguanylate cyclase [Alkalibacterium sp.]|nr:diguanylate cyclase [Alkalibacterium sp.]
MVSDLFVNFSVVISLIFIYMKLRWKSYEKSSVPGLSALIDGICGGTLGYLLMYFSINVTSDTIIDFRFVPVMLLVLFVSKRSALIAALIIVLGRFQIVMGLSAVYASYLMLTLLVGYHILDRLFKKEERMLRKGFYFTLYSNIATTYFLIIAVDKVNLLSVILLFWLTATLTGMSAVYLVNYIRNSEYLFNKYQVESSTDFLTGLSNVRQFTDYWTKVSQKAEKTQEACAIIMLDIDRFKLTNDTYGHAAGDYVLVELGRLLEESIQDKGMAFRKGGEEFTIVLPKTGKGEAVELAESIRERVAKHKFVTNQLVRIPVTISIGVAAYPETINQISTMVERADTLLYKSKNEGRNRVSV